MRNVITSLPVALLVATPLALAPNAVSAQDVEAPTMCTATVSPAELDAGEAAIHLIASLSEDIGTVTGIVGAESGITLTSPDALPRVEMSTDEEATKAIAMAEEGNSAGLWLSTQDSEAGTYQIIIEGENGTCQAEVTVTAPAG